MDSYWSILKILAALFLVFLNGFFVLAEFALVKVRRTRLAELAEDGSRRAKRALHVTSNLDAYLSACQLGITLASLGLGWLGEPAIASLLTPLFERLNLSGVYIHTISYIIAFSIITFLHIVFGELIPKSIAIRNAEKSSLLTAQPLMWFDKLFYPFIWSLNGIANYIIHLMGMDPPRDIDAAHSPQELKLMVDASEKFGFLDSTEGTILENVLDFTDRVASDVMVPRQDMVCIYIQGSLEEATNTALTYGYVRYPLCDGSKDNVIGMIHIKDLLKVVAQDGDVDTLYALKRDVLIVPETNPISHLLQKMRGERSHLAMVADEFGGIAGLVTIEDLVEELSGEIYDEFELQEPLVERIGSEELHIHGRLLLADLSEILPVEFEDMGVSTAGGFISAYLGRIAETGEEFVYEGYTFKVLEMERYRVKKIKITKQNKQEEKKDADT